MRRWHTTSTLFFSLCLTSIAQAFTPVQGFYAGFIVGASVAPTSYFTLTTPLSNFDPVFNPFPVDGRLSYDVLGLAGAQGGYRCGRYRIELQAFYNNNPYDTLTLGNTYVIYSPSSSTELRLKGATQTTAGMVNFYLDLYHTFKTKSIDSDRLFPYLGVGAGYSYITNKIEFYSNDGLVGSAIQDHLSTGIGQAIVGLGYFLDNFTSTNLDFRYIVAFEKSPMLRSVPQIFALSWSINGAFDKG